MNLAIGADCFIPSVYTVIDAFLFIRRFLLSETHENIAVFESRNMVVRVTGSPKPTFAVFYSVSITCITCNPIVLLVLVEVCEFVEFARYHGIKITANLRFRAL